MLPGSVRSPGKQSSRSRRAGRRVNDLRKDATRFMQDPHTCSQGRVSAVAARSCASPLCLLVVVCLTLPDGGAQLASSSLPAPASPDALVELVPEVGAALGKLVAGTPTSIASAMTSRIRCIALGCQGLTPGAARSARIRCVGCRLTSSRRGSLPHLLRSVNRGANTTGRQRSFP